MKNHIGAFERNQGKTALYSRCMPTNVKSIVLLAACFLVLTIGTTKADSDIDGFSQVVPEMMSSTLHQLNSRRALGGKRVAIFGFVNGQTRRMCDPLANGISDKLSTSMYAVRGFVNPFDIVPQPVMSLLEAKHLSQGKARLPESLLRYNEVLEKSDILISGNWVSYENDIYLTVKAISKKEPEPKLPPEKPSRGRVISYTTWNGEQVSSDGNLDLEVWDKSVSYDTTLNEKDIKDNDGTVVLYSETRKISREDLPAKMLECLAVNDTHQDIRDMQATIAEINLRTEALWRGKDGGFKRGNISQTLDWQRFMIETLKARLQSKKNAPYFDEVLKGNAAILSIKTLPENLDVYINDQWVGISPIKEYKVESGKSLRITSRGDRRYTRAATKTVTYKPGQKALETLKLVNGQGKIWLKTNIGIDSIKVNGEPLTSKYLPTHPVFKVQAGPNEVWGRSELMEGTLKLDVWDGDEKRPYAPFRPIKPIAKGNEIEIPGSKASFVKVPAGCFQMGNDDDPYGHARPAHEVCVDEFWISKYEVTQRLWDITMYPIPPENGDETHNFPVEKISWNQAQNYIKHLNRSASGYKYRLPTEAEWEYACRSGGKQERFCGGDDLSSVAHERESWTMPVGMKKPNGLGIYDMSGNVAEWVSDRYSMDYYKKSPKNNPHGAEKAYSSSDPRFEIPVREVRSVRGGSYCTKDRGSECLSTSRHSESPEDDRWKIGLRPVLVFN